MSWDSDKMDKSHPLASNGMPQWTRYETGSHDGTIGGVINGTLPGRSSAPLLGLDDGWPPEYTRGLTGQMHSDSRLTSSKGDHTRGHARIKNQKHGRR